MSLSLTLLAPIRAPRVLPLLRVPHRRSALATRLSSSPIHVLLLARIEAERRHATRGTLGHVRDHQLARDFENVPQLVVAQIGNARKGTDARDEQDLALVLVAEAGDDALIEQHVRDL